MRRAILAVLATTVGLVLLLSFKPHEINAAADQPAAVVGGVSGSSESDGANGRSRGSRRFADDGSDDEGQGDDGAPSGSTGGGGGSNTQGGGSASISSGSWTGAGATAGATTGEKVVTGNVVDTIWGPVQVQIVLSGGKMTGIAVLQAPQGNHRDLALNDEALPMLNDAALSAQSGQIDSVSGATYTSEGYIGSLQSALDKAGI
jgi:uncharacterized protein with FMN-binding domain